MITIYDIMTIPYDDNAISQKNILKILTLVPLYVYLFVWKDLDNKLYHVNTILQIILSVSRISVYIVGKSDAL